MSASSVAGERGVAQALKDVAGRVEAAHAKSGRARAVRAAGGVWGRRQDRLGAAAEAAVARALRRGPRRVRRAARSAALRALPPLHAGPRPASSHPAATHCLHTDPLLGPPTRPHPPTAAAPRRGVQDEAGRGGEGGVRRGAPHLRRELRAGGNFSAGGGLRVGRGLPCAPRVSRLGRAWLAVEAGACSAGEAVGGGGGGGGEGRPEAQAQPHPRPGSPSDAPPRSF
jgi:hypothetical protein